MSQRLLMMMALAGLVACEVEGEGNSPTTQPTNATTSTASPEDTSEPEDTVVLEDSKAPTEVAPETIEETSVATETAEDTTVQDTNDTTEPVDHPVAGQVVFSELMIHSSAVPDQRGEWIELTNLGAAVDLAGCVLRDEGTDLVVIDALPIAADARAVMGLEGTDNGGFSADYVYRTMLLDNVSDVVELVCDDTVIDRVAWTQFVWPVVAGRALALDPTRTSAADNDVLGSWCLAERAYGDGDRGTPGDANPSCPQLDTEIDGCALKAANPLSGFAGAPVAIGVEVREAGVTDATDGVDVLPTLVVEVGWGPIGAPPEGLAWTWTRAEAAEDLVVANGADGYRGPVMVADTGTVSVLARASRDGGETWRLCDRAGTLPAQPASLDIVTSPCTASSCVTPPSATCNADGVRLAGYEASGACTPTSASTFTCAYEPAVTDCGASGLTCVAGACAGAAAAPETGDIVFTEVMLTPTGGAARQWLELESQRDEPLALTDCVLEAIDPDGFAPFTLTQPTVIGRNGHVVVGASTDLLLNGGAPVDRAWGEAVVLGSSEGSLELRCGDTTIDYFAWDAPLWPVTSGAAMALSPYHTTVAANDVSTAWCAASASFGAGDRGTPGLANPACPGDVAPVSSCGFVGAIAPASPAGTTVTQALRVIASGITTKTTKTDVNAKLIMQTGIAARGGGAAGVALWQSAGVDGAWQVPSGQGIDSGEDRYLARVRIPAPGTWDLFVRATADGGNTWLVCDPTHPLPLDPVPSPCEPDPCGAPPSPGCSADASAVVIYGAPSECTLDDEAPGEVECHFAETAGDDCAAAGALCELGGCTRFPRAPEVGDLVISELMIAPSPTTTELGEWIELQSASADPIDLEGCELRSGPDEAWAVPAPAPTTPLAHVVMPGTAVVLARSSTAGVNGNSQPIAVWSGLGLANDADWVALECDDVVIDLVAWDLADGWVVPAQTTLQLSGATLDARDNDFAQSFCVPGVATPRVPNLVCPADDEVLEGCRLDIAASTLIAADEAVDLTVVVLDEGVTDLRVGPDPAYGTIVELGLGPEDDDDPLSSPAWTWLESEPDDGASPAGWDRWTAPWTPGFVGTVSVAARVSLDGGDTWTLCDRSGLDDGFTLDAEVSATATPCVPNPCHSSGASVCSGGSLVVDADPGTCTIVEGAASCAYTNITFSCGPYGGCNVTDGVCNNPPHAPALAGDLVITEVMRDSTLDAPDLGEWVELTNPTATPFDIRGCVLTDGFGEVVQVTRPVPDVVPAGGWAVFAQTTDKTTNGGVQPTSGPLRLLTPMTLANAADTLVFVCNGVEIDRLAWSSDWPGVVGQAMQLDRTKVTAAQNDLKASWCPATAGYGLSGNKGSPGLNNLLCP